MSLTKNEIQPIFECAAFLYEVFNIFLLYFIRYLGKVGCIFLIDLLFIRIVIACFLSPSYASLYHWLVQNHLRNSCFPIDFDELHETCLCTFVHRLLCKLRHCANLSKVNICANFNESFRIPCPIFLLWVPTRCHVGESSTLQSAFACDSYIYI